MMNTNQTRRSEKGFTLVELLVAMVIGLFIVGGVVSVMVDSKDNFIFEQEIAYIQENARFVNEELSNEIRMAAYQGCSESELANLVRNSHTDTRWMASSRGLWGFETTGSTSGTHSSGINGVASTSDILIINRGDQDELTTVASHVPSSQRILVTGDANFAVGDLLLFADIDCSNSAIFQTTTASTGSGGIVATHASSTSGNCSDALSSGADLGFDCQSPPAAGSTVGHTFDPGSSLMAYQSSAYYVKDSSITGQPTLYKRNLVSGGSLNTQEQELIGGVEVFDVIYGVDTDDPADGIVNVYLSANNISSDVATSATSWIGWDRVVSARATLILRSSREAVPQAQSVDFGGGYTYNDRFVRQKVVVTARARNRGL